MLTASASSNGANPPRAIMFHHFSGQGHPHGQGALSRSEFEHMLEHILETLSIPNVDDLARSMRRRELGQGQCCLTFDDALLCQYEVALPVLEERGLTAFFFVYSSIFTDNPDPLEIYRYFRTVAYEAVDDFYGEFFTALSDRGPGVLRILRSEFDPATYLADFPFYSDDDRRFRFLRDRVLREGEYHEIMRHLMSGRGFSIEGVAEKVWMTAEHVANLHERGHVVGLHSHSHPTMMHELSLDAQKAEYAMNLATLTDIVGDPPTCMSHPCGNYNADTLTVLRELGIDIGFRSNLAVAEVRSNLEIPREDHANVWREMRA